MKTDNNAWSLKSAISNCEWNHLEQTTLSTRYQESLFTFRGSDSTNGSIQTFITPDMEVSRLNITSNRNLLIIQDDGIERYVSTFMYDGYIHSQLDDSNNNLEQHRQQHSFVRSSGHAAGRHTIAAGNTSQLFINVKPTLLQAFLPNWEEFTDKIYGKSDQPSFFASPSLPIQQNVRMQQLLADLQNSCFSGITRNLHIEAKALELLALQLDDLLKHKAVTLSSAFSLSKADKEKLIALHEYVTTHFLVSLSLTSLARKFMLNEFKLKKGFRELYQQSVFNYILTLRMQQAKGLLLSGDRSVSEVSDLIGYSSINNFSNAFHKMYGYRPSMVMNNK